MAATSEQPPQLLALPGGADARRADQHKSVRRRWRVALAGAIVLLLGLDTPARIARRSIDALPDIDPAAEVRALREAGNFSAAERLAQAALAWDLPRDARDELIAEKTLTQRDRGGFVQRLLEGVKGAVAGEGRSSQAILGATLGDLGVAGDLRDLVVQGAKRLVGGETDKTVVLLSTAGVLTTLTGPLDVVPSLLKSARKQGAMNDSFAAYLDGVLASADAGALLTLAHDCRRILDGAGPGGFAGVIAHADNGTELSKLARFVQEHGNNGQGACALMLTGRPGAKLVLALPESGPGRIAGARAILRAARKGPAGAAALSGEDARAATAHPLLRATPWLWRGWVGRRLAGWLDRLVLACDGVAWVLVPLAGASLVLDAGELVLRARAARARAGLESGAKPS